MSYEKALSKEESLNQIQELDWMTINPQDLRTILSYANKFMLETEEQELGLSTMQFAMLMKAHSLAVDIIEGRKKWVLNPVTKIREKKLIKTPIEHLYLRDEIFLKMHLEEIVIWLERKFQ